MAQEFISPTWTLSMVLMWIISGDPEDVREVYNARPRMDYATFPSYLIADWVEPTSREDGRERDAINGLDAALALLQRAFLQGGIRVIGTRVDNGKCEEIPKADLHYFMPYSDNGRERMGPYTDLSFAEAEIFSALPMPVSETQADLPPSTGIPGRPTKSRDLILGEFDRRREVGDKLAPTLKAEAESLIKWLRIAYPGATVPGHPATRNLIRAKYNAAKTAHKITP